MAARSVINTGNTGLEHRLAAELRAVERRRLVGYAALFGVETRIGNFVEVIAQGAFAASLASGNDVLALVDHDASKLLARTKSGSLILVEDEKGLRFDIQLPDTSLGRDIEALTQRGDIGGMSFGFRVGPDGERWQGNKRQLLRVELAEISVVSSFPAYAGTSVDVRSKQPQRALRQRYLDTVRL